MLVLAATVGVSTSILTVPILIAFILGMIVGVFIRGRF